MSDAVIFRGKSEAFNDPPMGSYDVLQIDNTLCFERDTRLGLYAGMGGEMSSHNEHDLDWNEVNWGALQDFCYKKNSDRYGHHTQRSNDEDGAEVEGRATAKRKSRRLSSFELIPGRSTRTTTGKISALWLPNYRCEVEGSIKSFCCCKSKMGVL